MPQPSTNYGTVMLNGFEEIKPHYIDNLPSLTYFFLASMIHQLHLFRCIDFIS
jgi:hypothetical protein